MNKFSKAAFEEQCMTYILLYVIYEITCSAYILNIHIIYIYITIKLKSAYTRKVSFFFPKNFFFLFQHLLMLIYTKISGLNTKRTNSTFKKTELLSILDFRHF